MGTLNVRRVGELTSGGGDCFIPTDPCYEVKDDRGNWTPAIVKKEPSEGRGRSLGCRVQDSKLRVLILQSSDNPWGSQGLGFGVKDSKSTDRGFGFRIQSLGRGY